MGKRMYFKTSCLLFAILLIGCTSTLDLGRVKGSGVKASESRELDSFTEIYSNSSADLNITIGERQTVKVSADDNLLEVITTEVKGGKLVIDSDKSFSTSTGVVVDITVPELEGTSINGSGDINIQGLSGNQFTASINGSSDIEATGAVDNIEVSINGSGSADFEQVAAKKGKIIINGSGDIDINVKESLYAEIRGSGEIRYTGTPRIDSKVRGSGHISPR